MERVLTSDERERAGRFILPRDRSRFIVARALLRHLLASYLETLPSALLAEGPVSLSADLDGTAAALNIRAAVRATRSEIVYDDWLKKNKDIPAELTIDLEKRAVFRDGDRLQLTPHEYSLLRLFAENAGKLLTHRLILREVWGPAYQTESNYLHVYVSQLRRKLEPDPARPRYLLTQPGVGYRLVDPTAVV